MGYFSVKISIMATGLGLHIQSTSRGSLPTIGRESGDKYYALQGPD